MPRRKSIMISDLIGEKAVQKRRTKSELLEHKEIIEKALKVGQLTGIKDPKTRRQLQKRLRQIDSELCK